MLTFGVLVYFMRPVAKVLMDLTFFVVIKTFWNSIKGKDQDNTVGDIEATG